MIIVVNQSTRCTNDQVRSMASACARQVRLHAAPAWGMLPVPVAYAATPADAPAGAWVLAVMDDADQPGDLGWHTEDRGDVVYGHVFAGPTLDNGGQVLTGDYSVSSVLSHEVLETLCDPHVNLWADSGDGTSYAVEVADPVEGDSYNVRLPGGPVVAVSNFVLPAWFDAQAAPGSRFDWMGKVHSPYTMSPGGYVVVMAQGKVSKRFGSRFPEWKIPGKLADTSRAARLSAGRR